MPTSAPLETIADQLRDVGSEFHRRGWSLGTSSNYSVVLERDPLELLLTASGKDKGNLTRDDFVRVNELGEPVSPDQPRSSAETLLHLVAAQCGGAGAVLHTHSVWSTVLSDLYFESGGLELDGYEMLKGLTGVGTHDHAEWLPIFDNTQDIPALAAQVRDCFVREQPDLRAYLIRKHGMYTWGRDLAEARRHVEVIEFLLECAGRKLVAQQALAAATWDGAT